ncbi:hypothetical protein A946_01045 [Methylacidiphilum kamchatkense Kam1]|uniref:Heavy-metal resistance protein n=1 Tax=Methylacidiphilum kamchatkense Kam1 TaxID=1202785 RepID=A0A0C1RMV0_9BACT|nr:hypothetical protein [Methylacidiphilum kamchatkense]KIE59327.1 hypothetical protein A946_01045 [Methylacidiphilum kamchatkense Kam1]QDQ42702.1 hypothetical protein kam1_1481 [Methylacidiphilum kamchatkense Kam1]
MPKNLCSKGFGFFFFFLLFGALSIFPLYAQHDQHEKHKKMEMEQQSEEEHEGHKMGGMDHGMMGGMGHGMMGGKGGMACCGSSQDFDQLLKEVEGTKNPKATARKLRMKADLMKAVAEVLEKYAKELESTNP